MFWFVCKSYFLLLYGTNKISRAIVFLEQYAIECDGKSISFQLYWSIKGLIFDIH